MDLTLRQLAYFKALVDTGHFGRAAQKCNISQPALSKQINEMEEQLNVKLIDRTSRPFNPTAIGQLFYQNAVKILEDVEALKKQLHFKWGTEGPFRLGMIPTIAPFLLPALLPIIDKKLPFLDLHVREATTSEMEKELANGQLDAAIFATPFENPYFDEAALFSDHFLLAVSDKEQKEKDLVSGKVSLPQVGALKLLLLSEGHCMREQAQTICQYASKEMLNQIGASSLHTLIGLVAGGYGATLVPEIMISQTILKSPISFFRLAKPEPSRQIRLIFKKDPLNKDALTPLIELFKTVGETKLAEARQLLET